MPLSADQRKTVRKGCTQNSYSPYDYNAKTSCLPGSKVVYLWGLVVYRRLDCKAYSSVCTEQNQSLSLSPPDIFLYRATEDQ